MLLEGDQWRFSLAGDIHSGRIDSEILFKNKQTPLGFPPHFDRGFGFHPSVSLIKLTQLLTLL